tara:strand:- start:2732 stop:3133 length:402 start_codon:yes stop_codon:yes gene_type:complete
MIGANTKFGLTIMAQDVAKKPTDKLRLMIAGEQKELFMSFALLNTLIIPFNTIDQLIDLNSEPDLRNFVLEMCLAKRGDEGEIVKKFPLHTLSISEAEPILDWVKEHIEDFFITRLTNQLKTQRKVNQALSQH